MPLIYRDAVFSYPPFLDATKYWTNLQCYRKHFPDNSIKVILFEELTANTQQALRRTCNFLNINQKFDFDLGAAEQNPSEGKKIYNPWLSHIRKFIPEMILRSVPEGAKNLARASLKTLPVPRVSPPELNRHDEKRVREILTPEVEGIYRYLGLQDDPWNFFADNDRAGKPTCN